MVSENDKNFISKNIPEDKLLGFIGASEHIKDVDKEITALNYKMLSHESMQTLHKINKELHIRKVDPDKRLSYLFELHKKYVSQAYVKDRFGDLTNQIDTLVSYKKVK